MAYIYLGYGKTNEQGIATLDHDAQGNPITHSYTGTGAGELDIIASLDDNTHISDRSIQSGTYRTLDCIQYDSCTTGTVNSNWLNSSAFTSVSSDPTGMSVINNTSAQQQLIWNKQGTSSDQRDWDYPSCIEFEILEMTGSVYLMCRSESNQNAPRISNYGVGKHRIEVTDSSMKYFFEDELKLSYDYDNTLFAIRFHADASSNFKLKDFKVYPI